MLYEQVLNELADCEPSSENDYVTKIKCENMNDFVRLLATEVMNQGIQEQGLYLVS